MGCLGQNDERHLSRIVSDILGRSQERRQRPDARREDVAKPKEV
jgi:hypothetical protein